MVLWRFLIMLLFSSIPGDIQKTLLEGLHLRGLAAFQKGTELYLGCYGFRKMRTNEMPPEKWPSGR